MARQLAKDLESIFRTGDYYDQATNLQWVMCREIADELQFPMFPLSSIIEVLPCAEKKTFSVATPRCRDRIAAPVAVPRCLQDSFRSCVMF